jgi:integrase
MAERVHGPYAHRNKWRVVVVAANGKITRRVFETEQEARDAVEEARTAIGHRSVGEAVREYLDWLASRGRRESTRTTARYRLLAFFRLVDGDYPIRSLTPARARELYARRCTETRPDTHRGELALATSLARREVSLGHLPADPFAGIEPQGQRSAGKDQLRLDEAQRFLSAALRETSPAATACALALLTGARASEVTDRLVRDVDARGALLWIPTAKTRAGVRQLAIPELLRGRVLALVAGRPPTDRLWGDVTRHWLGHHVRRLCRAEGIPVVSPHGLRGLNATLRVLSGEATDRVAQLLGQAGPEVTRRHYLAPGVEAGLNSARIADLLLNQRGEQPAEE